MPLTLLTYFNTLAFVCSLQSTGQEIASNGKEGFSELLIPSLAFVCIGILGVFAFFFLYSFLLKLLQKILPNRLYGLIGFPLEHSFSKKYFTEKFKNEEIKARYELFEIASIEYLPTVLQRKSLCGFNVTAPYKEKIFDYLNEVEETAKKLGAVNVVKICKKEGETHLKGYNTDIVGFRKSIEKKLKPEHRKALILGTGGAAKAIAFVLEELKIETTVVSRSPKKQSISYQDIDEKIIKSHLLIVNASPLGTYPNTEECPDIPYEYINDKHLLFDVVYNPSETLFLKKGKTQNAIILNGEEMLIGQAEAAWEIWNKEEK